MANWSGVEMSLGKDSTGGLWGTLDADFPAAPCPEPEVLDQRRLSPSTLAENSLPLPTAANSKQGHRAS